MASLPDRQQHQAEVQRFLQKHFASQAWQFSLPHGFGNESYFAHGNGNDYFVKLNAPINNYLAMASIGLSPTVIASGVLEDGTSLLVQPYIEGRKPLRKDYRKKLEHFARSIHQYQHSPELRQGLTEPATDQYIDLGMEAFADVEKRWERYRPQVPEVAPGVDKDLGELAKMIEGIQGKGAVVSHNDICNANWIITPDEQIYLIDLDAMAVDDPAYDLGALLWWYYPPTLRPKFLELAGYENNEQFRYRMQVRMAIHCLHILLPRMQSYDRFNPGNFTECLTDFKAILAGKENPQGYD